MTTLIPTALSVTQFLINSVYSYYAQIIQCVSAIFASIEYLQLIMWLIKPIFKYRIKDNLVMWWSCHLYCGVLILLSFSNSWLKSFEKSNVFVQLGHKTAYGCESGTFNTKSMLFYVLKLELSSLWLKLIKNQTFCSK